MDTEDSNSTPQTERDRINEQLDELRQSQQERKPKKKDRPRWKRRLLGFLGVISGLFLLGTSCSKPTVTCYRHADPEDEDPIDKEETFDEDENEVGDMCYCPAYVDESGFPAPVPENLEAELAKRNLNQESENDKQESPINNADNAETNDGSDTPKEE